MYSLFRRVNLIYDLYMVMFTVLTAFNFGAILFASLISLIILLYYIYLYISTFYKVMLTIINYEGGKNNVFRKVRFDILQCAA